LRRFGCWALGGGLGSARVGWAWLRMRDHVGSGGSLDGLTKEMVEGKWWDEDPGELQLNRLV